MLNEKDKNNIEEFIHSWVDISIDDFYNSFYCSDIYNEDNKNNNVITPQIYRSTMEFTKYIINIKIIINPINV